MHSDCESINRMDNTSMSVRMVNFNQPCHEQENEFLANTHRPLRPNRIVLISFYEWALRTCFSLQIWHIHWLITKHPSHAFHRNRCHYLVWRLQMNNWHLLRHQLIVSWLHDEITMYKTKCGILVGKLFDLDRFSSSAHLQPL